MEFTVWGIITALVVGLIVGALGRLVVPGRQNMPIWLHMVIGVGAALLGTVLARALGIATQTAGIDWAELAVQVVLAAIGWPWWPASAAAAGSATGNLPIDRKARHPGDPVASSTKQCLEGAPDQTVGHPFESRPGCPPLRYGRLSARPCRKEFFLLGCGGEGKCQDGDREKWREQVESAGSGHRRRGLGRDAAHRLRRSGDDEAADDSKLTVWMMGEGGEAQTSVLDGVETEFRKHPDTD